MAKMYHNIDEDQLLMIAHKLETEGNKWLDGVRNGKDYLIKNREIIHVLKNPETMYYLDFLNDSVTLQCERHPSIPMTKINRYIPAFSKKNNQIQQYKVKFFCCKYCKKFYLDQRHYASLMEHTYPFADFSINGILVSSLTEKSLGDEERSDLGSGAAGLYEISKDNLKRIPKLVKKTASIPVCMKDGTVVREAVTAYYSWYTGQYYVYSESIRRLKEKGVILCRLLSDRNTCTEQTGMGLNVESLIHQFGYNVSQKENLSAQQRH